MAFGHYVRMRIEEPKDRLRKAREEAGYDSPTEAAKHIRDINKNTLISHENGNRAISRKAAELYADAFGRTPGWYLYGDGRQLSLPETSRDVDVAVASMVAAGRMREQQGVLPADINRYIRVSDLPPGDWLALVAEGDSMNRIAPDGSLLVVNRADSALVDGRFYIFALGGGEATFKRYRRNPDRLQPYSTDPDFTSIPVDEADDLYVFGRVRKIIQDV